MTDRLLVCPFRGENLSRLKSRSLVIRTDDPEEVAGIPQHVKRSENKLHVLMLEANRSLSEVPFQESWRNIPLAVHATDIGDFPHFMDMLPLVRTLNLRVFLPLDNEDNYTGLRILSSLGVPTVAIFGGKTDWEGLSDLMTYAILARARHAPMDPFNYVASHYDHARLTDFSSVYFEDPSKYLHLDREGRVALTGMDLAEGRFIADDIDRIEDISICPEYVEMKGSWRNYFLEAGRCSSCQGWRVCLGKFSSQVSMDDGCKKFISELMDVAEQYQSLKRKEKTIWQI